MSVVQHEWSPQSSVDIVKDGEALILQVGSIIIVVISLGYSRTNGELLLFYITNMSLMHPVAADMHDERGIRPRREGVNHDSRQTFCLTFRCLEASCHCHSLIFPCRILGNTRF